MDIVYPLLFLMKFGRKRQNQRMPIVPDIYRSISKEKRGPGHWGAIDITFPRSWTSWRRNSAISHCCSQMGPQCCSQILVLVLVSSFSLTSQHLSQTSTHFFRLLANSSYHWHDHLLVQGVTRHSWELPQVWNPYGLKQSPSVFVLTCCPPAGKHRCPLLHWR